MCTLSSVFDSALQSGWCCAPEGLVMCVHLCAPESSRVCAPVGNFPLGESRADTSCPAIPDNALCHPLILTTILLTLDR